MIYDWQNDTEDFILRDAGPLDNHSLTDNLYSYITAFDVCE
jgi:hypothetical protein